MRTADPEVHRDPDSRQERRSGKSWAPSVKKVGRQQVLRDIQDHYRG